MLFVDVNIPLAYIKEVTSKKSRSVLVSAGASLETLAK